MSLAPVRGSLDPSPDDARSSLRRELLDPEYYEDNLVQRLISWIERQLGRGVEVASQAPPLTTFAVMLIAIALVGALAWLLSRARRTARAVSTSASVLTDEVISAADLRRRAEAALAAGDHAAALVDGFRALAARQVELGRLDATPGTTAHEVAARLSQDHPRQSERLNRGALCFDAVRYGDRSATHEQAVDVLGLGEELVATR